MSGTKRTLSGEDNSPTNDDSVENRISPNDSPMLKRSRRSISHSDNEETQIIESEDGGQNDDTATHSENEDEMEYNDNSNTRVVPSTLSLVHVDFDDGKNDPYRYDGTIVFHIHVPRHPIEGQISSEPSIIRTFEWTLLSIFKRTTDSLNDINGNFGLFVKWNVERNAQNSSIFAKSELTLLHPTNTNKNIVRKLCHLYSSRSVDWGFHQLTSLKEIYSEYIHLLDNTVRIHAKIHVDPPRHIDWNSKLQTGFVGLRNMGATCYINSFLQTMYFIKKLRKAVYGMPTDYEDQTCSIPLALQKIFYDLQFNDAPPDEFCQHDIQEFCRVLLDKLEETMQGTTMEGIIPSLFQGEYVQYVRCTQVNHESRVQQTFYDVPLQVRNNANITESFRDFCKSETLTGDNLYDAGSVYGLQEAEKGVKFKRFPPVLCLHLLRFEYDYTLAQNRKINDSYSFDYHLDLSEFLEKPNCSLCTYKLLSILVHSGDNSSGHYVSFINPQLDEQWFKFDDQVVARVAPSDAMERNFGGTANDDGTMYNTSAYMLIYIRDDYQNDVLCDITLKDIPSSLVKRFDCDKKMSLKRRQNATDADSLIEIRIILNNDFIGETATSLTEFFSENSVDDTQKRFILRYMKVNRSQLLSTFLQHLAYEMGVNLNEDIRLWLLKIHDINNNHHHHHHIRCPPSIRCLLIYCDDYDKKITQLFQYEISNRKPLSIYVEQKVFLNGTYQLLPFNKDDDILLFVHSYDPRIESIIFIGHFIFSQQKIFQKCLNEIAIRMNFSLLSNLSFIVHQNILKSNQDCQYDPIESSNFDLPVSKALHSCLSGSSIIVQIIDQNQTNSKTYLATIDEYFSNIHSRLELDICNRDSLTNDYLFKLYLPLTTTIKDIIRSISERIDYPEQQIIIHRPSQSPSFNSTSLANIFHIGCDQKLKDLIPTNRAPINGSRKLFFKRLPFIYKELDHRRLFCLRVPNSIKRDAHVELQLYAKKSSTIGYFLDEIKQWIPRLCSENINQKFQIVEVALSNQPSTFLQLRICSDGSIVDEYSNINRYYLLEHVVKDEIDPNKDATVIPVAHYTKENGIHISIDKYSPFFLHVIHNETFGDVKERLQKKLGLTNREFDKYCFSIFNGNKLISRCDDNTERINLCELKTVQSTCWIGLEIPLLPNTRKTRKSLFTEKPIRIN